MIRSALLAATCLCLGACGFSPMYAPSNVSEGAAIAVPEIKGRTGHFLRQELVKLLGRGAPGLDGAATLEVDLNEGITRLAFAVDQAASRSDYNGTADWVLRDASGKVLASGRAQDTASFNFADSPYADVSAQTAAQERLASLLAQSIRTELLVKLADRPASPAGAPAE
ncbi:MAG: LPS assembly lipoprotein LptE [Hyphomonadaceae bacterium]